ncbi:MAG TPA: hypothetical protein VKB77_05570 [Terriglobales bacterium]|nr:hypothetical protein [Terriglobales bacterium]
MASPLENRDWLDWVDKVIGTPAENPSPRECQPFLFSCHLEDQPDHLVPNYALDVPDSATVTLNPRCQFLEDGELPPEHGEKTSLAESLDLRGHIAWVPHPASGAWQPFGLSDEWARALGQTRAAAISPGRLPRRLRKTLTMAGILLAPDTMSPEWEKTLDTASRQFRERGYAAAAGLIHPFHVSALRRYYRHQVRTGRMNLGDGQSSRRYVAHNDRVARFFHHQLTAVVAKLAGEPVKPSYVYVASYQEGAELQRHTDREQCEFSITFCLDYSPEPALATGWPLTLHTDAGTVTVYQALGDALLYRGRQLPHSRAALRPGHTSTSMFFHYVREDFAGPLD